MYRLVAAVVMVAALLVWPAVVDAESNTIDAEGVSIVWVDLDGPTGPVSRGDAVDGVADHGHAPVRLVSVTVDDGGLHSLTPLPVAVTAHNISYGPDTSGVATSENGALTTSRSARFPAALARTLSSQDLRHYLRHDDVDDSGDERDPDYDLRFSPPLAAGSHLVLAESAPDAVNRLQALGPDGAPLPTAPVAVLAAGVGWNTGFASADRAPAESVRLTVLDVDRLLTGTGAEEIHGVRVANAYGSDFKVIPVGASGAIDVEGAPPVITAETSGAAPAADALRITSSVYVGADGGRRCTDAGSSVDAGADTKLTYCYLVTNTGDETLNAVSLAGPESAGAIRPVGLVTGRLAPGRSARYYAEGSPPSGSTVAADGSRSVTASVTAVGVDTATPYTARAETVVRSPADALQAAVALRVTAYSGVDGGASCPGTDRTMVTEGDPVTYCFVVDNTGNTALDDITVDQLQLDTIPTPTGGADGPLAPNVSRSYHLEAIAPSVPRLGVIMSASVEANPVDPDGTDLGSLADVVSHDGTEFIPTAGSVDGPQPMQSGPSDPSQPIGDTGDTDDDADDMGSGAADDMGSGEADAEDEADDDADTAADDDAGAQVEPDSTDGPTAEQSDDLLGGSDPDDDDDEDDAVPSELAFTGWETWLIVTVGIALVAGGWAAIGDGAGERQPQPATVRPGPTVTRVGRLEDHANS